ncbi:MAG: dual specificity protein phosphatase family protein [Desulfobacterales bacterium]|nr:dual specificity protein phosphatase family protein [Desulfobacterales bacterium]
MIFSLFKKTHDPVYPLTWVTPQLAVGHAPMSYEELDSIKRQGIKAIMNLCLEIEELAKFEQEQGFDVYYLPIMDAGLPEVKELEKALDWLDEAIYLGKKVLIHCRHGIGRTGTVVYAYLLRKGLDSKKAKKKMRGIRSQPTEHPQKRFLYKYGKKEAPLNLAEPSLIPQFKVELSPYFDQVSDIFEKLEADISEEAPRCGRDHSRCCYQSVRLSLAEAVYLQFSLNTELTRELRQECIQCAIQTGDEAIPAAIEAAPGEADLPCPLLKDGRCILFDFRPAQCRVFDRSPAQLPDELSERLKALSREILEIFIGPNNTGEVPEFHLPEVVCGKFVQRFFYLLANPE